MYLLSSNNRILILMKLNFVVPSFTFYFLKNKKTNTEFSVFLENLLD